MGFPLRVCVSPGTRLVVAIAPEFTIGLVRPSPLCSMAVKRIERQPCGVDADPVAQRIGANRFTDEREDERLGDAHDRELMVGIAGRVGVAAGPDHADPEQVSFRTAANAG